jgi:hypothetical protein
MSIGEPTLARTKHAVSLQLLRTVPRLAPLALEARHSFHPTFFTRLGYITMVVLDTGIPLLEDVEEPLLSSNGQGVDKQMVVDEDLQINAEIVDEVHHYFLIMGWTLGFLLQCISLGATAAIALYWEDVPTIDDTFYQRFLYWIAFGLSNSWLLLFPMVCVGMQRSWKESGIRFLLTHLLEMNEPVVTKQARRMTFVASVRFLIGVILGCFLTWGFIDLYLNASQAMLWALLVSMMGCLTLCQGMIAIYDCCST